MTLRTVAPCVVCQRPERIPAAGLVCDACRTPLPGLLHDVLDLYVQLDLTPASGAGQRVSGSREAPLPLSVTALDLALPARALGIYDPYGDGADWQTGDLPVASVLDSWVRDWRDLRAAGERPPAPTVSVLVSWLTVRLDWACDNHPAIDEFADEMRKLRTTLRRTVGDVEQVERLWTPCKCDLLALVRVRGERYPIQCRACGAMMTEDEYAAWTRLVAAAEQQRAA